MIQRSLPTACLIALSIYPSWFCAEAAPPSADRAAERLVRPAAERIAANYARIPTFRVRMRTTLDSPGVKEPTRHTAEFEAPPEGGVQARRVRVEVEVSPVVTWTVEIIVRGEDLWHEQVGEDEDRCIRVHHRGVWTQYMPQQRTAWRYSTAGKPGWGALDPRDYGSFSDHPLRKHLHEDRVVEAQIVRRPDGSERLAALMEHWLDQAPARLRYRCEFDPSRNSLPTRVVQLHPDEEKVAIVTDIEYEELRPGELWFPKRVTQRIYLEGAAGPDAEGWSQLSIHEVQGRVAIDETFADSTFQIEFPPGTDIRDSTQE